MVKRERDVAFDASPCDGATMADIDDDEVRWFAR